MRIMNFSQFLNESSEGGYSSFEALPKPLRDFFIEGVGKNILSKVIGLKNFSIELQGSEVYFVINGNRTLIPFINYIYDEVEPNIEALKDDSVVDNFYNILGVNFNEIGISYSHANIYGKILKDEGSVMPTYSYRGNTYNSSNSSGSLLSRIARLFYPIFTNLRDTIKDETPLLNPFTDIDLNNNTLINLLDKLGAYVDTSEGRKKKGILRFSLRDFNYGLIIQPNGYIRIDYGHKTPVLTTNIKITGPVYTEDDLNLKLAYFVVYIMKDILKKYNVPIKTINLMTKLYGDGDFNGYDSIIKEISAKYPGATSLLPDPNSVLDPNVKKGSSMLRRFGVI